MNTPFILLLAVVLLGCCGTVQAACPPGYWFEGHGSCWKYTRSAATRAEAEAGCNAWGGTLATIATATVNNDLLSRVNSIGGAYVNSWWIGLTRRDGDQPWEWQDSTSFTFSNWAIGQPNDAGDSEDCSEFRTGGGAWNDLSCSSILDGYICSTPSVECDAVGTEVLQGLTGFLSENAVTYSNSRDCVWVINPDGLATVNLDLVYDTESVFDTVTVYDGAIYDRNFVGATVLGTYSGAGGSALISSSQSAMTIKWHTDFSINDYLTTECESFSPTESCSSCGTFAVACNYGRSCTACGTYQCNCGYNCHCDNWGCDYCCSTCCNSCYLEQCTGCNTCDVCNSYRRDPFLGFTATYTTTFSCNMCSSNAVCDDVEHTCTCNEGYTGSGTSCTDINECDAGVCGANSNCNNLPGTYQCSCLTGFEDGPADGFACENIDECAEGTHNCVENAECTDASPGWACACALGYAGVPTVLCSDIDECAIADTCGVNTTCTNEEVVNDGDLGYSCSCLSGYAGDAFGEGCADINECEDGTCDAVALCTNLPGDFNCICPPGYTGDGLVCTDVNECDDDPCDPNADCANSPGTYSCTCSDGYSGNGFVCSNINECAAPSQNDCDDTYGLCFDTEGSYVCACVPGWTNSSDGNPSPGAGSPVGFGTVCYDVDECTFASTCLVEATCINTDASFTCNCPAFTIGDGVSECRSKCTEEEGSGCNSLAYCEGATCLCPEGLYGDGIGADGCTKNAWAVRFSFNLGANYNLAGVDSNGKLIDWVSQQAAYLALFPAPLPPGFATSMHHEVTITTSNVILTINALFSNMTAADAARSFLTAALDARRRTPPTLFGVVMGPAAWLAEPRVYRWVAKTTSAELQIMPTGLAVDAAYFEPSCLESGCWVVDVIYTLGEGTWNVLYLPRAVGDDTLSFDFDYDVKGQIDSMWGDSSVEDTFLPRNFPCRTHDYMPDPNASIPMEVTACCIPKFIDLYRPIQSFVDELDRAPFNNYQCKPGNIPRFLPNEDIAELDPNAVYDGKPADALSGLFAGMNLSHAVTTGVVDPYIRQYTATLYLDEVELRRQAGKLIGTVGVEYSIDTFIGFVNFKPTGSNFLDPFATQVNMHFERTSFFSVSTHGENQYTFLEYINLRLVAVYQQDTDLSETSPDNSDRTTRTDPTGAAHYLQVTFTVGPQYQPIETGLIPLDSVRVGQGTFMATATADGTTPGMFHPCQQYTDGSFASKSDFDARIPSPPSPTVQTCAPAASMCLSPASIPDQFVSFNIPLGIDWIPAPSQDLSSNVFVDLVVSAIDVGQIALSDGEPNAGSAPEQMKTTLTASIPSVEGGVNIFCDGIVAKTDLKDVSNADLIIGSAASAEELTRLRILEDIATTDLSKVQAPYFETDSIEAGLITLVLKGNQSYFSRLGGTGAYGLQLDDVVTIHILEPTSGTAHSQVSALLAQPGDDNSFSDGLDTDGYALNGAFYFAVDRAAQTASLEPTAALLEVCPFSPRRPTLDVAFPTTCVLRRDVRGQDYPARTGSVPTATEIAPLRATPLGAIVTVDDAARDANGQFMQTIMGQNEYAMQLGKNYSYVVANAYKLDGRSRRAFWINPGYEWTPTQTGGRSIFSISQKIFFFALIRLDEQFGSGRRRRLLSNVKDVEPGSGVSGAELEFAVTPTSLLARVARVSEEQIARLEVTLRITAAEACMPMDALRVALSETVDRVVRAAASDILTVQVFGFSVDRGDEDCSSRRRSGQVPSSAKAKAEVVVVFSPIPGEEMTMDVAAMEAEPEVMQVRLLAAHDSVATGSIVKTPVPGPAMIDGDAGSSDNTALIAGVAGAGGGAMLLIGAAFLVKRNRARDMETSVVTAAAAIQEQVRDLKTQLQPDEYAGDYELRDSE